MWQLRIEVRSILAYCMNIEECMSVETEADRKPWYHDIKAYIKNGQYPSSAKDNEKKFIRCMACQFFLSGEVMYKRNHNSILPCIEALFSHTSAAFSKAISKFIHISPNQRHCFSHTSAALSKAISRFIHIGPTWRHYFSHTTTTLLKAIYRFIHIGHNQRHCFHTYQKPAQRQFPNLYI